MFRYCASFFRWGGEGEGGSTAPKGRASAPPPRYARKELAYLKNHLLAVVADGEGRALHALPPAPPIPGQDPPQLTPPAHTQAYWSSGGPALLGCILHCKCTV